MAAAIRCFQCIKTYLLGPSLQKDTYQASNLTAAPSGERIYELSDLSLTFSGNEQP